jgi:hypothetical protein
MSHTVCVLTQPGWYRRQSVVLPTGQFRLIQLQYAPRLSRQALKSRKVLSFP